MGNAHPGTILVTGGSRGIGAATVRLAARAGHAVCFSYHTRADAAQAVVAQVQAAGGRAFAVQAQVRSTDDAVRLLRAVPADFPPLVGLVNNVGITGPLGAFDQTTEATMREVLEVNVLGMMLLTQQLLRQWKEQAPAQGGSVVNVSSIAATLGAPGEYVHYAASKAAVEAFTVGLAKEVARLGVGSGSGVRVNCVSPGTTLTDIHAAAGEPGRPQRVAARIPMQRPGEAEEIAEAIVWLLSPKASYATGSVLKVAGGL